MHKNKSFLINNFLNKLCKNRLKLILISHYNVINYRGTNNKFRQIYMNIFFWFWICLIGKGVGFMNIVDLCEY